MHRACNPAPPNFTSRVNNDGLGCLCYLDSLFLVEQARGRAATHANQPQGQLRCHLETAILVERAAVRKGA